MSCPDHVFDSLPGTGWLTRPEADLLWDSVVATEGLILEVGCYYGRSTKLLVQVGTETGCYRGVHAVDPFIGFDVDDSRGLLAWQSVQRIAREHPNLRVWSRKIEHWEYRHCYGPSIGEHYQFGFCYLDGDHTYNGTIAQIEKALECNPQAIAIHDVNDSGGGADVKEAALELLGPWNKRVERLAVWEKL